MDKSRFLDDPFPFISFLCTAIWRHIKGGTILFDIPSIDQLFDLMFSMSHAWFVLGFGCQWEYIVWTKIFGAGEIFIFYFFNNFLKSEQNLPKYLTWHRYFLSEILFSKIYFSTEPCYIGHNWTKISVSKRKNMLILFATRKSAWCFQCQYTTTRMMICFGVWVCNGCASSGLWC